MSRCDPASFCCKAHFHLATWSLPRQVICIPSSRVSRNVFQRTPCNFNPIFGSRRRRMRGGVMWREELHIVVLLHDLAQQPQPSRQVRSAPHVSRINHSVWLILHFFTFQYHVKRAGFWMWLCVTRLQYAAHYLHTALYCRPAGHEWDLPRALQSLEQSLLYHVAGNISQPLFWGDFPRTNFDQI